MTRQFYKCKQIIKKLKFIKKKKQLRDLERKKSGVDKTSPLYNFKIKGTDKQYY